MTPVPASPLDDWTLNVFLDAIRGSTSKGHSGHHWTAGLSHAESNSPTESKTQFGHLTDEAATGYSHSPTVQPEHGNGNTMDSIRNLVVELADDIDNASRFGALPFTGEQLKTHYREMVRVHPLDAVLTDLRHRRAEQVECRVLPLTVPATGRGVPC